MPRPSRPPIVLRVPAEPWPYLRLLSVGGMIVLAALAWVRPSLGLPVVWGLLVPALPLVWMLAPGLWRNVCPMASANQIPRLLGVSLARPLPRGVERYGFAVAAAVFLVAIAFRPSTLDQDGPMTASLLLAALLAAVLGGVVFKGKSGYCGSICPLRPVQAAYSRAPAAQVEHAHCATCVGCTTNCPDLLPGRSLLADLELPGPGGGARWVFLGALPGINVAFGLLAAGSGPLRALAILGAWGLLSLGLLTALESLTTIGRGRLTALWGGAAAATFYWSVLPMTASAVEALSGADVGSAAVWEARLVLGVLIALWVARSLRLAAAADRPAAGSEPLGMSLPVIAPSPIAAAHPAPRDAAHTPAAPVVAGSPPVSIPDRRGPARPERMPTVTFWPAGTVVSASTVDETVAAAARRAGLTVPEGCGTGLCGCDPVYVVDRPGGLAPAGHQEAATLRRLGLPVNARLACSARIVGDVVVSLEPAELADRSGNTAAPAPVAAGIGSEDVPGPVGLTAVSPPAEPPRAGGRGSQSAQPERIVVLGNGVAGLTAASQLRRLLPDCRIDVVSRSPHPFYNRIAITRLVDRPQGLGALQLMPDRWYEEQRIHQWLNTTARAIDREHRTVELATGELLPYDRLVIATGATWARPAISGVELTGVFGLREAADAMRVRRYVQELGARRAAVIGGGLLGLEAGEALARLGLDVVLVERSRRLADQVLDERSAALVRASVERAGVRVHTGRGIAAFEGDGRLQRIRLDDDATVDVDLAVVCIGIRPELALAREAGLVVDRGIVVDERMRTSDPAILACGDVAEVAGRLGGHWSSAAEQAEVAAAAAAGGDLTWRPGPTTTVVKLDSIEVVSVGIVRADEQVEATRRVDDDGRYEVSFAIGDRPVGLIAVGGGPEVDERIRAIQQAAVAPVPVADEQALARAS